MAKNPDHSHPPVSIKNGNGQTFTFKKSKGCLVNRQNIALFTRHPHVYKLMFTATPAITHAPGWGMLPKS